MSSLKSKQQIWAEFRFSIIGRLLANPPEKGKLASSLKELSKEEWQDPISGKKIKRSSSTLERWLIAARKEKCDSVSGLLPKKRSDTGQVKAIPSHWQKKLKEQHKSHSGWTWRLHSDNLKVMMKKKEPETDPPGYDTVRRFMKANGLFRVRRINGKDMAGLGNVKYDRRSFESPYVGGIWCFDFHHGKRTVLNKKGEWIKPIAFAIIDDHSRLIAHMQWFSGESAEELAHGLIQAFLKRGLPRSVFCDNGSAMRAAEIVQGFARLGIMVHSSAPYDPQHNGKIENFWGKAESHLMAMLENKKDLTLLELNRYTQAWIERGYNRSIHSETKQEPYTRFIDGKSVMRSSPTQQELVDAFRMDASRVQRRTDGTVSIEGIRLEIPLRYRAFKHLKVRYARWNPVYAHLVSRDTNKAIVRLYVLDKHKNINGKRERIQDIDLEHQDTCCKDDAVAPLLEDMLAEFSATGHPPAFIHKEE